MFWKDARRMLSWHETDAKTISWIINNMLLSCSWSTIMVQTVQDLFSVLDWICYYNGTSGTIQADCCCILPVATFYTNWWYCDLFLDEMGPSTSAPIPVKSFWLFWSTRKGRNTLPSYQISRVCSLAKNVLSAHQKLESRITSPSLKRKSRDFRIGKKMVNYFCLDVLSGTFALMMGCKLALKYFTYLSRPSILV